MKKILFFLISIFIFILAIIMQNGIETQLLQAFISPASVWERNLVKLANLSSNKINIILEANSPEELDELRQPFHYINKNFDKILEVYKNFPANFLTQNTRNMITDKNYAELEQRALEGIYNPLGIYAAPLNKDPYLLATDFLTDKTKFLQDENREFNGKFYSVIHRDIESDNEIKEIINNAEGKNVYLTGTPVHSYYQTKKSNFEINLICLISTLALIWILRYYFKTYKIIIPVMLSILFGFMFGYSIAAIIFRRLHVLTFVFSTSLIGISLDYVLHYFITGKEKGFRKSLTSSMLTTVLAFSVLLFSNIEVLKQIAVFTSAGLIGVWAFVLIALSGDFQSRRNFNFHMNNTCRKLLSGIFSASVGIIIILGITHLKFDDNIKNFYTPPLKLAKSEMLYSKVFNPKVPEFIPVTGKSIDEILEKEEKMNLNGSLSLSDFVSSTKRQKENISLVKKLYDDDWEHFKLQLGFDRTNPDYEIYNPEEFPLISEFMLDNNTGFIMSYDKSPEAINVTDEISNIIHRLRQGCFTLLPVVFGILFLFLAFIYGIKNAIKISAAPAIAVLFTIAVLSLTGIPLNLFNILALFLIAGFSLDYSIFRLNGSENSKDAVFMSAASTAFSFFLLALTSFKLISSLALTICIGIAISYLLSLVIIRRN